MNLREQIKEYIFRAGFTMSETVEALAAKYNWSDSLPGFTSKLRRGTLRYQEALEIADVLGYEIVWKKRSENECP